MIVVITIDGIETIQTKVTIVWKQGFRSPVQEDKLTLKKTGNHNKKS